MYCSKPLERALFQVPTRPLTHAGSTAFPWAAERSSLEATLRAVPGKWRQGKSTWERVQGGNRVAHVRKKWSGDKSRKMKGGWKDRKCKSAMGSDGELRKGTDRPNIFVMHDSKESLATPLLVN